MPLPYIDISNTNYRWADFASDANNIVKVVNNITANNDIASNTYLNTEISKKLAVSNATTLLNTKLSVANASALYTTKAYAASNTYVNTELNKKLAVSNANVLLATKLDVSNAGVLLDKKLDVSNASILLGAKAANSYVNLQLAAKADNTYVNSIGPGDLNLADLTNNTVWTYSSGGFFEMTWSAGATANALVRRTAFGRITAIDAAATNEVVTLNQLNTKLDVTNSNILFATKLDVSNATTLLNDKLGLGSGTINALTEKSVPVDGDWIIIDDSEDSNTKKKVQIGNLPGGEGGSGDVSNTYLQTELDKKLDVANASALYTTKAYAAANSYVNTKLAVSNANVLLATKLDVSNANALLNTKMSVANTNAAIATTIKQGVHTVWVPAAAMTPKATNGAEATTYDSGASDVTIAVLAFDTTTQEYAHFTVAMPKSWNASTVTFIPYWTNTGGSSTQTVVWSLAGRALGDSDAINGSFGTAQTSSDTWLAQNDVHLGPESNAITIGNSPTQNDLVVFEVSRVVGSDNMSGDALLVGIKLLITINATDDS